MKQTGIIMSGDHPKLILDSIKAQTRRVIKPQPNGDMIFREVHRHPELNYWYYQDATGMHCYDCPYGQVGDRLWVRETFCESKYIVDRILYRTEHELPTGYKWKPSIHMPRWASRITLEITEVRVERVNEISLSDIYAEGCPLEKATVFVDPATGYELKAQATEWFADLWDSLNAKRGYGWASNPWVWVISFKVVR